MVKSLIKRALPLVFLLIFSGLLLWWNIKSAEPIVKHLKVHNGVLDITNWDFEKDGVINLNGDWEFYWNKLLNYSDFHNNKPIKSDGYIKVPSVWNGFDIKGHKLQGYGYATYRLKVKAKDFKRTIHGLRIISMSTSYKFMINNQLIASNGIVGVNKSNAKPEYKTETIAFNSPADSFEIIIQVSNYTYSRGGIWHSIYLGTDQQVLSMKENVTAKEVFIVAVLIIIGIYHAFIYLLEKRNKSSLYFVLTVFVAAMRILFTGDHFIKSLLPGISLKTMVFVEYMTIYWGPIMWAIFVNELYPDEVAKKLKKFVIPVGFIVTLFTLSVPPSIYTNYLVVYEVVLIFAFIYILYCVTMAYIRKRDGADLMLGVAVIALMTFVNDVLYYWNIISNKYDGTFCYAVVLGTLVQAFILAKRYSNAFKEVEILSDRLISLDKLKDEFLAVTSHELRTPLNGIINVTQSLLKSLEGKLDSTQNQDIQIVIASSRRLYNLINNLLDISSLKNNEIKLNKKPVSLKMIADTVIFVMNHLKGDKKIIFENNITDELPPVFCDEDRLGQILYNLIGNALKFTEKGYIKVNAYMADNMISVFVEDSGIGIPENKYESIFNSFEQVDSSISRKHEGTGLGLYITRQLVELHGGKIQVKSKLEQGSCFSFILPIATKEQIQENDGLKDEVYKFNNFNLPNYSGGNDYNNQADYSSGNDLKEYNILAVDDDIANLKALVNTLSFEGYAVKGVTSGYEALKALKNGIKFELVILDVMMPEVSGYDVLTAIRKKYSQAELPVLFLTALHRSENISMGFKLKANDYLSKPFESQELIARVNNLVQLKRTVTNLVQMELSFLQAQIKPHFIYNALSVISSLCIIEPEKAKELILDLSDYLRGNFDPIGKDGLTTIKRELALVKAYLAIEQERFHERIKVLYDVDENISCTIPMLSIQPLVENAVRHGIMKKLNGGKINIFIQREGNNIKIKIEDNGVGVDPHKAAKLLNLDDEIITSDAETLRNRKGGVGLKNIHRRLVTLYGEGLKITGSVGVGTTVEFLVPIINGKETHPLQFEES